MDSLLNIAVPLLGVLVQISAPFWMHDRIGKGKIVTMPMWKRLVRYAIVKKKLSLLVCCSNLGYFRGIIQLAPALVLSFIISLVLWQWVIDYYWAWLLLLYADDYLTGIDYKKKWDTLKNKIKWRKFAPSPILQPTLG